MSFDAVKKHVERALKKIGLRIEVVTDLSAGTDGIGSGTGITGDDVPGELAQRYGFYSVPPDGGAAVALKWGGLSLFIGYRHPEFEPQLEKTEVAIASSAGAAVKLDKDGNVKADSSGSAKVLLQGGGRGVARINDTVDLGSFGVTIVAGVVTAVTWVPPGGGAPLVLTAIPAPLTGKVSSASSKTEADNS